MHGSLNTDVSFRVRQGQVYIIPGHLHAVYDRHFESIMSEYGPVRQRESVRYWRFVCAVPLSRATSISSPSLLRNGAGKRMRQSHCLVRGLIATRLGLPSARESDVVFSKVAVGED